MRVIYSSVVVFAIVALTSAGIDIDCPLECEDPTCIPPSVPCAAPDFSSASSFDGLTSGQWRLGDNPSAAPWGLIIEQLVDDDCSPPPYASDDELDVSKLTGFWFNNIAYPEGYVVMDYSPPSDLGTTPFQTPSSADATLAIHGVVVPDNDWDTVCYVSMEYESGFFDYPELGTPYSRVVFENSTGLGFLNCYEYGFWNLTSKSNGIGVMVLDVDDALGAGWLNPHDDVCFPDGPPMDPPGEGGLIRDFIFTVLECDDNVLAPGGAVAPCSELGDADADLVCDDVDNCVGVYNPAEPDGSQLDTDGDGAGDCCDPCPTDPNDLDTDEDCVCDVDDNCPTVCNPFQENIDEDEWGDVCDFCKLFFSLENLDGDGDGYGDDCDNCPDIQNPHQLDFDNDGYGNDCDNCPEDANPLQEDGDQDDVGDACDNCLTVGNFNQTDSDLDTIGDDCDNCPLVQNADQTDTDGDTVGDVCDNCVFISNMNQADNDSFLGDKVGDVCDNCPFDYNPNQEDEDLDGVGTVCDICPEDYDPTQSNEDGDAYGDVCDVCPEFNSTSQADEDGDGIGDDCDLCPGVVDLHRADRDNDGVGDACDNCPDVYNPDQDNPDGDQWGTACDNCPTDVNDDLVDTDGDGIGDACDNCPLLQNPDQINEDNDSHGNVCDNCDTVDNEDQANEDGDEFGDVCDPCVYDPNNDEDDDTFCCHLNSNYTGDPRLSDNCCEHYNPHQNDADQDGLGDVCDICPNDAANDEDDDGLCCWILDPNGDPNAFPVPLIHEDLCCEIGDPDITDFDGDGYGNECDPCPFDAENDIDEDGYCCNDPSLTDLPTDNCCEVYNLHQLDVDQDGLGNECDPCPFDGENDIDEDGVCCNEERLADRPGWTAGDICCEVYDPNQRNRDDGDDIGDACDLCPVTTDFIPFIVDDEVEEVSSGRFRLHNGPVLPGGLALEAYAEPCWLDEEETERNFLVFDFDYEGALMYLDVRYGEESGSIDTRVYGFAAMYNLTDTTNATLCEIDMDYPPVGAITTDIFGDWIVAVPGDLATGSITCANGDHWDITGMKNAQGLQLILKTDPILTGLGWISVADETEKCTLLEDEKPARDFYFTIGDCDEASPPLTPNCRDFDEDGVCCEEDNCCDVYNPDQSDVNFNGVGDVCDPIEVGTDCVEGEHFAPEFSGAHVVETGRVVIEGLRSGACSDTEQFNFTDDVSVNYTAPTLAGDDGGFTLCGHVVHDDLVCHLSVEYTGGNYVQLGDQFGGYGQAISGLSSDTRVGTLYCGSGGSFEMLPAVDENGHNFVVDFTGRGHGYFTLRDDVCTVPAGRRSLHFDLNECGEEHDCACVDLDLDDICEADDNCALAYNPTQLDSDLDGIGNECDNCPFFNNPEQLDGDEDLVGDDCDLCPDVADDQTDTDNDDIGDACDLCPELPIVVSDSDGDGVGDECDNCPDFPNAGQEDGDGDLIGDVCDIAMRDPYNDADKDTRPANVDNCPWDANRDQEDRDGDGIGDVCDECPDDAENDGDGDGICGDVDNCPNHFNPLQTDWNDNGIGGACEGREDEEAVQLSSGVSAGTVFAGLVAVGAVIGGVVVIRSKNQNTAMPVNWK